MRYPRPRVRHGRIHEARPAADCGDFRDRVVISRQVEPDAMPDHGRAGRVPDPIRTPITPTSIDVRYDGDLLRIEYGEAVMPDDARRRDPFGPSDVTPAPLGIGRNADQKRAPPRVPLLRDA